MTRKSAENFYNADGTINTTRAMDAGHQARCDALRDMAKTATGLIREKLHALDEQRSGFVTTIQTK